MSRQQTPASVRDAVCLLCLQATIWALLSAGTAYGSAHLAMAPARSGITAGVVVLAVLALVAGAIAAGKFWLSYRLPRGTNRTRETVITVEGLMGGFAGLALLALLFVAPFGMILSPPVIVGGIMSVLVAHGLTKPPARHYFDASEHARAQNSNLRSPDSGATQFRACLASA